MDSLRISDADRESATELLSEQYAVGRLTKDEFDERSDAVWSARTQGDLAPIFADLPVRSPVRSPARSSALPARAAVRRSRRWPVPLAPILFVAIALTVVTHVPFVLLALAAWFLLSRRCGVMSPPWAHGSRAHRT